VKQRWWWLINANRRDKPERQKPARKLAPSLREEHEMTAERGKMRKLDDDEKLSAAVGQHVKGIIKTARRTTARCEDW
jgi:hypothetical protein